MVCLMSYSPIFIIFLFLETLENPKSCSSPNYVAVLSPQPPEENADEARTVINSLKHFTAPENLCASNAYECENCCAPHNKTVSILLYYWYTVVMYDILASTKFKR